VEQFLPIRRSIGLSAAGRRSFTFEGTDADTDFRPPWRSFRDIDPQVVVFGEYPMPWIEPFPRLPRPRCTPLLMLEQYYGPDSGILLRGVDYLLMYGVSSGRTSRCGTASSASCRHSSIE